MKSCRISPPIVVGKSTKTVCGVKSIKKFTVLKANTVGQWAVRRFVFSFRVSTVFAPV